MRASSLNIKSSTLSLLLTTSLAAFAVHTASAETIKVGQTQGPHAQIMQVVKKVAAKNGLDIQVVEFSDYIQPNAALDSGDIDANNYQTLAFMQAQIDARGYKIVNVANTVLFPMGFYSKKYKSIKDLPEGATVGIQNDPANASRSLQLLEKYGVIKLNTLNHAKASVRDIAENPKHLKVVQIDAGQLPRSLDDFDAAAINTSFAVKAGLIPKRDAIAIESADSPYSNLLVVRAADKQKPWVQKFIRSYQSPEVKQFIETEFGSFAIPSF